MLAGDAAAAEDVAQNALLRAYGALERFRGDASLDTWFYRILVREVQRQRRWQALRSLWSSDAEVERVAEAPRASGDPGLRRRISNALRSLSTGSATRSSWSTWKVAPWPRRPRRSAGPRARSKPPTARV
jgi:DNA-directed RNA polymerase specialized sigma24 family protein